MDRRFKEKTMPSHFLRKNFSLKPYSTAGYERYAVEALRLAGRYSLSSLALLRYRAVEALRLAGRYSLNQRTNHDLRAVEALRLAGRYSWFL